VRQTKKSYKQVFIAAGSFLLIFVLGGQSALLALGDKQFINKNSKSRTEKEVIETGPVTSSILPAADFGILDGFKTSNVNNVVPQAASVAQEVEPNNTPATATPIGRSVKVKASNIYPNGDIDFYSFQANAGDRVYAATMTSFSAGSSTDSQLTLLASDGTTTVEFDDDNGTFAGLSSSIAGAVIPSTGTYYLKVNDFTAGTTTERPYDLWVSVQSGTPTPEVEPNDTPGTANPLPANGWVSGTRDPAVATEQDWYSMTLNAGDTVYLGLDLNPERDGVTWNGRLGMALFGDANNQILVVDDAGTGDVTPVPNNPSEALFVTVKNAGTYYAFVDSATAAVGGPTSTYHLNVTVLPRDNAGLTCTTYASTNVPQTIGPGTGLTSSTITVPGNPRIAKMRVGIELNHALMADLDVQLRSPAGNDNGLFTDIGAAATGGQQQMDLVLDDDAGTPFGFTVLKGLSFKPELNYRLGWFNGENAGGTWTLDIRDDTANTSGGTLTNWNLEICTEPTPGGQILYQENFEPTPPPPFTNTAPQANDGGYTHSGTADEWQYGIPNTPATTTANPVAAFTNCNNNSNGCWKTDLTGTYNVSSNQDLFSPNLSLLGYTGSIQLEWAMKYQMESASFDHAFVEVQDVNNPANNRIVWQWLDATMTNAPGNPVVNIPASAGWGTYRANISDFSGKLIKLRFHLDSDTTVNFGGVAIDDVIIRGISVVAANVAVSGRVVDSSGVAIPRTTVSLTGSNGVTRTATTNSFGYYRFDDVHVGETYVLDARRKGYIFSPSIVTVQDELANADITAIE